MNQVAELEAAILARAERLGAEYRERAERSRERILSEAKNQLRLREDREVLVAKALAERSYRRKVQSSELKLHAHMDHLRWNLVRGVEQRLEERMQVFARQEEKYLATLRRYLAQGVALIEREELVVELNAHDQQWLAADWPAFVADVANGKAIELAPKPINTLGGILVRSLDGRIRLDNTFEGRRERLRAKLHQIIVERLIPVSAEGSGVL
jgi:V/A-type H+-transporting ATPase subunit E